jgi:hypothetical protein
MFLSSFIIWMALRFSLKSQALGPGSNQVLLSLTFGILVFLLLVRAAHRTAIPHVRLSSSIPFSKDRKLFG